MRDRGRRARVGNVPLCMRSGMILCFCVSFSSADKRNLADCHNSVIRDAMDNCIAGVAGWTVA
jgi:hypothetical protein